MPTRVNLDGSIVPAGDARISVFDRGFLFGDSVYETVRSYAGQPFLLDRHLARFERSAGRIGLEIPGGLERVRHEVRRTREATGAGSTSIRFIVTRGAHDDVVNLDPTTAGEGSLIVIARELAPFDPAYYARGVDLAVVGVQRNDRRALDPSIKSGNYLNNVLALAEAKRRGAFESLMLNREGQLAECSTSNVFLAKDGALLTPALECGLLDGITRGLLLELAREAGIEAREAILTPADLAEADEVFLSASLKEVIPVRSVDGVAVAAPGPLAQAMLARYRARVEQETGFRYGGHGGRA